MYRINFFDGDNNLSRHQGHQARDYDGHVRRGEYLGTSSPKEGGWCKKYVYTLIYEFA